jgi:dihydrofolate reductase
MRKIIVAEFISLDGVVESPQQWHFPYVNEEMFGIIWGMNDACDTMLLGRVTYDDFASAFANAPKDDEVATRMNKFDRVVVTSSPAALAWANSTALDGDVSTGIAALKQRPGRDILTTGSIRLVRSMLRDGLVDELNLLIHPIVVGKGQRLFEDDGPQVPLSLVGSTTLSTGVVHAVYQRA